MTPFEAVSISKRTVLPELRQFRQLLDAHSNSPLRERDHILPFFRAHRHLAALIGTWNPGIARPDRIAFEFGGATGTGGATGIFLNHRDGWAVWGMLESWTCSVDRDPRTVSGPAIRSVRAPTDRPRPARPPGPLPAGPDRPAGYSNEVGHHA
jgi:hypothetical protein